MVNSEKKMFLLILGSIKNLVNPDELFHVLPNIEAHR